MEIEKVEDVILKLILTRRQYEYVSAYIIGMTVKEIAECNHVTPAAVSNVLAAARRRINTERAQESIRMFRNIMKEGAE